MLNPPTQYASDGNLRARQRLWQHQVEPFDVYGWVLGLGELMEGDRVLDLGCGNGRYLSRLVERDIAAVGCDLSQGMLRAAGQAGGRGLITGDAQRLPFRTASFDAVLAPFMLYHVPDRRAAAAEMRRVLRPIGPCVVVTNGPGHMRSLRVLIEAAVREATPGWEMRNPSTHAFGLANGAEQLAAAFGSVDLVRPDRPATVALTDASVAADYVASVADHYQPETNRPWAEVVEHVRSQVQHFIDADGSFVVVGDTGAFVCREGWPGRSNAAESKSSR